MSLHHVWTIPLFSFIFSFLAFFVSYAIALSEGHVAAFWPYISDSGTFAPESCVFSQLLNLAALFLAISVYLRHRQIIEFYWHSCNQKGSWRQYSTLFLWIGYVSAFGVSMVGNFQQHGKATKIHYTGAFLAFTFGLIYLWAQTMFSYLMNPRITTMYVAHFRLLLNLFSTSFFCTSLLFTVVARPPSSFNTQREGHLYKWTPSEAFYKEHMIATISEWLLAITFQMYILSFAVELRQARCHAPKLKINVKNARIADISCSSATTIA